ncbi:uncharacterized protein EV420DRAFT_1142937 [Desarmillaria tabescens]|uniref:Uncharacterized protein n=1 Tax=Armillaria tabescens TaxID=1929756 RepID=A0AA39NC48_ARMTA|nr:uncharacterized protein EV420DRAFT_1142937 [Desarmillaria tabescens]KAK0462879.1 hypothetical protein EV420DRAFT_1142937 [Desarmillaria tabescens]
MQSSIKSKKTGPTRSHKKQRMNILAGFIVLVVLPFKVGGQSTTESITISVPPEVTSFLSSVSVSIPSSGVIPFFPSESSLISSVSSLASEASSIASVCATSTGTCTANTGLQNAVSGGMVIASVGVGLLAMVI